MDRRVFIPAVALLAALAVMPSDVGGQQKNNKNKNKAEAAVDQDYYLIQNQKAITGQLIAFDDANHSATVRINFPEWMPNPKYRPAAGAQHNLMVDYQRLSNEQARLM